jgi:flagellin
MIINHNISALNTYNQLSKNQKTVSSSLEKLSSGLRINKAADDAAGLAISQKMTAQVNGLNQAERNAQDGISLIQTAEGAIGEIQSVMQRMTTLAVQSANDTNADIDRAAITTEFNAMRNEIDRIADGTQFNQKNILDGTYASGSSDITLQIGANQDNVAGSAVGTTDIEVFNISDMHSAGTLLAIDTAAVDTYDNSSSAITTLQTAINSVSTERANLGAMQNRLEHTINNLTLESQNLATASAQITDVNMANEMTSYTKNNVLMQAAQAMLAQANQLPQGILNLLK